jgi:hypothetical protein
MRMREPIVKGTRAGGPVILAVRAKPNARADAILGWEEGPAGRVLVVAIAAPPTEGKANAALLRFLGGKLGIAPSRLSVRRGGSSRLKHVEVPDGTALDGLERV